MDEGERLVASAARQAGTPAEATRFWRALYLSLASISWRCDAPDRTAAALAALPVEARTALLLRIAEAMPPAMIAATLDEPEARARRHLATGLAALREVLGDGRPDAEWIADVRQWLDSRPAFASVPRIARVADPSPVVDTGPLTTASPPRPWRLWLALALALAAIGALRLWLEGGRDGTRPAEPVPATSPLETMLELADEDFALIADGVDLDALARLDFLIWDADADAR